ncbi:elymoclavine monooxygenase [Xylaria nigripes]|nr:elymoclavine monooxygenase [Xylaria nigripes]
MALRPDVMLPWASPDQQEQLPIATLIVVTLLVPLSLTVLYRIYLHPLRNIPGPRLAALSNLYGVYYNVFHDGFSKSFESLHKHYNSPVIRIGPNHVHINKPSFYEEVFRAGSKYPKDAAFYAHFGGLDSMIDPKVFHTYRNHIASLYSTKSADRLAPRLLAELQSIEKRLKRTVGTDEPVNIERLFRTLSADMVLHLIFPQDIDLSEYEGYHPFLEAVDVIMKNAWPTLTYPLVPMALGNIPFTNFSKLKSAFEVFTKYGQEWADDAQLLLVSSDRSERDCHMKRYLDLDRSDKERAKAVLHPLDDIFNFIAGGRDTTAYTMSCAMYYLHSSPGALAKLRAELDDSSSFIRENFDHKKIHNLPYLSAVIKEVLRISSPVPGCLPRIVPNDGATVGSIHIPAGTAVSVSLLCLQRNPDLFPEPEQFRPERWLTEGGGPVERWHVAFSRGPRQCIGVNIAHLELHSCLAYLLSHFEFSLPKGAAKKLEWVDRFVATNIDDVKVTVDRNRWE